VGKLKKIIIKNKIKNKKITSQKMMPLQKLTVMHIMQILEKMLTSKS